jgi:hypothetical protein
MGGNGGCFTSSDGEAAEAAMQAAIEEGTGI